jgi:hypothetical protein
MEAWHYLYHWIAKNSDVQHELNNLGKEGWELIGIIPEEVELEEGYRLFFKRECTRLL